MDETAIPQTASPTRKRLALAATVALAVVLGVVAFVLWQYGRIVSNVRPSDAVAAQVRTELSPELTATAAPRARETEPAQEPPTYVLVMGSEAGGDSTLSTLVLVRLARADAKASVLWIPPKAVASAAGRSGSVSEAFVSGGPAAAIRRVKEITGLPVHHYVRVEASGIAEALDVMGGVCVDPTLTPQPSTSPTAPPVAKSGGLVLNGSDVLAYAQRSQGAGPEAEQGLLVVNAALTQAKEKLLGPSALSLLLAASRCTETDMGPGGLLALGESMRGAMRSDVAQHYLSGPRRNGVMLIGEGNSRVRATVTAFATR